mmetsp:Transcript_18118/g.50029  ORF Transcript_18118/g.50029 Transcript_18118/m.50029 type:complete len:218 (-) Transcript_18118:822-1475(-)
MCCLVIEDLQLPDGRSHRSKQLPDNMPLRAEECLISIKVAEKPINVLGLSKSKAPLHVEHLLGEDLTCCRRSAHLRIEIRWTAPRGRSCTCWATAVQECHKRAKVSSICRVQPLGKVFILILLLIEPVGTITGGYTAALWACRLIDKYEHVSEAWPVSRQQMVPEVRAEDLEAIRKRTRPQHEHHRDSGGPQWRLRNCQLQDWGLRLPLHKSVERSH